MGRDWNDVISNADGAFTADDFKRYMQDVPPPGEDPTGPVWEAGNGVDHDDTPGISDADVSRWIGVEPPELRFTVSDLIPEGAVTLLAAEGGAGKSILKQLCLTCIAAGVPFLGRSVTAGAAAGVFAEDPDAVLHIRQARINHMLKIDMADLAGRLFIRSYFGQDARLWREGQPTPFLATFETALARIPALRLVTLDNAALMHSGGENDREDVTAFIAALNGLADRRSVGLILSTHQSKSRTDSSLAFASGSTAWVNACRSALEIRLDDDASPQLILRKANHTKAGLEISLEWRDAVLTATETADAVSWIEQGQLDRLIFTEVANAWERRVPLSPHPQAAGRYLPQLLASKSAFKARQIKDRTMGWIASGHIATDQSLSARMKSGLKVEKWPDGISSDAE